MFALKILILGGTHFLGPHIVEELQKNGHEITLFNRGITVSPQFINTEKIQGDREGNLHALEGRRWDAIIDTSAYLPRIVKASSKVLAQATNHYVFISTISVYENFYKEQIDENYPVAKLENDNIEIINDTTYGALKASCEQVIQTYFPDRYLIIRPGVIVGPGDCTNRFSYWPLRLMRGGEILAPNKPENPIQYIDVRDLAKWIVAMIERKATGVYNAIGPKSPLNFQTFLQECRQFCTKVLSIHWLDESFLLDQDIQDWTELPFWISSKRNMPGFFKINSQKAIQTGLSFRPLSETISALLEWEKTRSDEARQSGLHPDKEQRLLDLWKQQNRSLY